MTKRCQRETGRSCRVCSDWECPIGQYRSTCTAHTDSYCKKCTNAPAATAEVRYEYTAPGNDNDCEYKAVSPAESMEGDLGGFEGTEPAKLVMFLELPVGKEEFLRIADPVKQALAATAKVASPDKIKVNSVSAYSMGDVNNLEGQASCCSETMSSCCRRRQFLREALRERGGEARMSEASVFAATVALAPEAGAADGSASGAEEDSARTGAGVQDASPASRHLLAAATNSSNSSQAPASSVVTAQCTVLPTISTASAVCGSEACTSINVGEVDGLPYADSGAETDCWVFNPPSIPTCVASTCNQVQDLDASVPNEWVYEDRLATCKSGSFRPCPSLSAPISPAPVRPLVVRSTWCRIMFALWLPLRLCVHGDSPKILKNLRVCQREGGRESERGSEARRCAPPPLWQRVAVAAGGHTYTW
eukprot:Tamp_08848.p1 GENE.Tamp_08848~~Tamp_08848.p1  ORF type:complete len:421 (+),score=49.22 Tamp_08848:188-1450(+)